MKLVQTDSMCRDITTDTVKPDACFFGFRLNALAPKKPCLPTTPEGENTFVLIPVLKNETAIQCSPQQIQMLNQR